jgi:hypothetical protein
MTRSRPKSRLACAYCGHRLRNPGRAATGRHGRRFCPDGACGGKRKGRPA